MSKPRKRRRAVGEDGAMMKRLIIEPTAFEREAHQTANISNSWSIQHDSHDGFKVLITETGHIKLTQHAPFSHEVEINLHPDEARKLQLILPDAIDDAEFLRSGGVAHE